MTQKPTLFKQCCGFIAHGNNLQIDQYTLLTFLREFFYQIKGSQKILTIASSFESFK